MKARGCSFDMDNGYHYLKLQDDIKIFLILVNGILMDIERSADPMTMERCEKMQEVIGIFISKCDFELNMFRVDNKGKYIYNPEAREDFWKFAKEHNLLEAAKDA